MTNEPKWINMKEEQPIAGQICFSWYNGYPRYSVYNKGIFYCLGVEEQSHYPFESKWWLKTGSPPGELI